MDPLTLLRKCLNFNLMNTRCGRGRGYYDTYLAKCSEMQVSGKSVKEILWKKKKRKEVKDEKRKYG